MKRPIPILFLPVLFLVAIMTCCKAPQKSNERDQLADTLENHSRKLNSWTSGIHKQYDTVDGGFLSTFTFDMQTYRRSGQDDCQPVASYLEQLESG